MSRPSGRKKGVARSTGRMTLAIVLAAVFALIDCTHAGIADPCGAGRKRAVGTTVMRRRPGATKAFVFVQGLIGETRGTPDLFWPERIVEDSLFESRDVYVLTMRNRIPECIASEASEAAIGAFVHNQLHQYRNVVMITNDIRHVYAMDQALNSGEERVSRVFLFNTPAADRLLLSLPQTCGRKTNGFSRPAHHREGIVCSTFDRRRLAASPMAAAVCGSVLVAEMSSEMKDAASCDDALYPIFRGGLASTAYESEQ